MCIGTGFVCIPLPSVSVPGADLQDGSILFRFGDEPSTSASEDSETLSEQTQQTEPSPAPTPAAPEAKQQQPAVNAVKEQVSTTNDAQEQEHEETEQPVVSASEDSVDEETSDSDTASEALANMTPDKLENMKVSGSVQSCCCDLPSINLQCCTAAFH